MALLDIWERLVTPGTATQGKYYYGLGLHDCEGRKHELGH